MRRESIAAYMMTTRLVLALVMIATFTFCVADFTGTYMLSVAAHRDICIVTPKAYINRLPVYFKLLSRAFGVCDASRKWLKHSDVWL